MRLADFFLERRLTFSWSCSPEFDMLRWRGFSSPVEDVTELLLPLLESCKLGELSSSSDPRDGDGDADADADAERDGVASGGRIAAAAL